MGYEVVTDLSSRLRTRVAYVQNREVQLDDKRDHRKSFLFYPDSIRCLVICAVCIYLFEYSSS